MPAERIFDIATAFVWWMEGDWRESPPDASYLKPFREFLESYNEQSAQILTSDEIRALIPDMQRLLLLYGSKAAMHYDNFEGMLKWLKSHLEAHKAYQGLLAVGGSICIEPNAPFWARCDHYCSWYNVNPGLPASWVPNHPCANLSIRRQTFERLGAFQDNLPRGGVNEEARWQSCLLSQGGRIRFEPRAAVWHVDRNDLMSYLKHNYWWAYNSITVKNQTGVSRFPRVYKRPWILVAGFLPFAMVHTIYTAVCWLRVGNLAPFLMLPVLFLGRLAYATGMFIGRIRWTQRG